MALFNPLIFNRNLFNTGTDAVQVREHTASGGAVAGGSAVVDAAPDVIRYGSFNPSPRRVIPKVLRNHVASGGAVAAGSARCEVLIPELREHRSSGGAIALGFAEIDSYREHIASGGGRASGSARSEFTEGFSDEDLILMMMAAANDAEVVA